MLPDAKVEALKRLNYIEGHLSGIRKMMEENQYCVDILKQTYAVRRATQNCSAASRPPPPQLARHNGRFFH